ncbi:MAG: hypothetical protein ACJAR2_001971 [Ilumatobacter sp.]|jgi:hypothetical protein
MTDATDQPPGGEPLECGEFHCRDRCIAGNGWKDSNSDVESLRAGERSSSQARRRCEETIFDHPQLIEPIGFEAFGHFNHKCRAKLSGETHSQIDSIHIDPP